MSTIPESENAKVVAPTTASIQNVENIPTPNTETPESTESEFTRAAVEGLGNRVRVTDSDEANGLELFCYVKCGPEDVGLIRQCRGVVFHEDNIVMRAFPYTVEYAHTDDKQIDENIQSVLKDCSFYDAHEGALIRMFNFSGRWYTSTHRKLNAFRSKWASKESFGTSFKRALEAEIENNKALSESIPENGEGLLERFQSILDPAKQYMFLVRHTDENRIVCAPPNRPTLFHVGTFVDGELVMTEDINVPYPKKHTFLSMDGLIDYVSKVDIRDLQGVIVFAPDNKQYKVLHKDYQDLFRARGNEPSIKYRYLQVRMNGHMVDMLYHLYPDMVKTFDEYENTIYAIAKLIYRSYVQRFIKKKWVTVAGEEFNVIRECHAWHEEDRKQNRISLDKVIEKLNEQTPTNLNKMIRRFHNEKDRQQEDQKTVQFRNRSNTVSSANNSPTVLPVKSPLLLTKNRKRNPTLPLSPKLGPPAVTNDQPNARTAVITKSEDN
jgi:hypothetical protein